MKFNGRVLLFTIILIVIATACKFFFGPSLTWSGFSPVIAIALFSGMMIKDKSKLFILPLIAVLASDLAIQGLHALGYFPYAGFYKGQWLNYSFLLLATLIGVAVKGRSYTGLLLGAIAAPTVFFLVSNFSVWASSAGFYTKDFQGLMTCYTAALPFYKNALMATLLFVPVIMFVYTSVVKNRPALTLA